MSKFKAGDRVKFLRPCIGNYNDSLWRIGSLGTVQDKMNGYDTSCNCYVKIDECLSYKNGNNSDCCVIADDNLELVEPKPKFKVGDRVRIDWKKTNYTNCYDTNYGEVLESNYDGYVRVRIEGGMGSNLGFKPEWLLLEGECGSCAVKEFRTSDYKCDFNEPTTSSIKKSGNIMSKLTSFVKNSLLSADEKLLRKYGLKDDCGDYTNEAEVLVAQKLIKDNEAYLIEVATAMEAEEKKNK